MIVIVSSIFPPEPLVSGRLSDDIAQVLSETDEVIVLCPPPSRPIGSRLLRKPQTKPFKVVTLPSFICPESKIFGRLKESYSFGRHVADFIHNHHNQIKCIYANTHPTFGQYLLLKEAHRHSIPCIIHIQDIYPESLTAKLGIPGKLLNAVLVAYDRHMMHKASSLIAISERMRSYLIKSRRLDAGSVHMVFNWQDDSVFKQVSPESSPDNPFTFMYVGSISPSANIPLVIKAFALSRLNDARLVIAGDGTDKILCVQTAARYPDAKIEFIPVSPLTVPKVQSEADVLLLPLKKGISKTALPSKLPAYLFSGKPVIACCEDDSDIAAIINDASCGWIAEPDSTEALSSSMHTAKASDRALLRAMGQRGKTLGFQKLSREVNLSRLTDIIKSYC
ncbi:MAG: glycosyltransferase family 4 protein [Muribaculum sp.]|nr:glycosyltransferase family 4 protein [Muribaculum sp.]